MTPWIDNCKCWAKINYKEPTMRSEIYNHVIWFNSQLTGQKFYYVHGMYQAGMLHL